MQPLGAADGILLAVVAFPVPIPPHCRQPVRKEAFLRLSAFFEPAEAAKTRPVCRPRATRHRRPGRRNATPWRAVFKNDGPATRNRPRRKDRGQAYNPVSLRQAQSTANRPGRPRAFVALRFVLYADDSADPDCDRLPGGHHRVCGRPEGLERGHRRSRRARAAGGPRLHVPGGHGRPAGTGLAGDRRELPGGDCQGTRWPCSGRRRQTRSVAGSEIAGCTQAGQGPLGANPAPRRRMGRPGLAHRIVHAPQRCQTGHDHD